MTTRELSQGLARASAAAAYELAIARGDLSQLSPDERLAYYRAVCESLGLNPLTRPFDFIKLSGGVVLYAKKDATDQLRALRGVSITKIERETTGDLYVVTAYARDAHGREDSEIGAVSIKGLGGEALANALMKATTKAKRRVTLSLCGLGWLDETEVETIPEAAVVDVTTGEVVEARPALQPPAGRRDQLKARMYAACQERGLNPADVAADIQREFDRPISKLTDDEFEYCVERVENGDDADIDALLED